MVLPKTHGAAGCAHCHQLDVAPKGCRICGRSICRDCATKPRSCPVPHPRELRLGLGGRLREVDPALRQGLYTRVGLHLYDLEEHRPRPGMLAFFSLDTDAWLPLPAGELLWVDWSSHGKCISGYAFLRREGGRSKVLARLPGDQQREVMPRTVRRSEHGRYAFVVRTDETVDVIDTQRKAFHGSLAVAGQVLQAIAASEDAGLVVAASFGQLFVFGLDDCQLRGRRPLRDGDVRWLAIANGLVCACNEYGQLEVLEIHGKNPRSWQPLTGFPPQIGRGLRGANQAALSPDGALLARGRRKAVEVYSIELRGLTQTLRPHTDTVSFVRFSGDGSQLITADDDNRVVIWPRSGERVLTLEDAREANRGVS
jgi:WD40 repeat protein